MSVAGWVRSVFRRLYRNDQVSVMPGWAIWIGALVVLVVGALSGWLLLGQFGAGTAQDRIQLEILKLAGSIVVGTGGGVALLLAARRQRATEVDIAQKKRAAEDARHDATERRVTELYTKAAEQLGSDKAAVRLAGLYALERLADGYPEHRPTIVEVICAYLRMPYTPPSADGSPAAPSDGQARRRRGLRPPNRRNVAPSPMRTMTTLASTLSGVVESGQDQHQELQVRLAAQRVLTGHLRPVLDEQGRPTNQKFWPDVELDLAGAVLSGWDMGRCQIKRAWFDGAEFHGSASFDGAEFHGSARFGKAEFHRPARFGEAEFHGSASFGEAEFHRPARFGEAEFHGSASFGKAEFHRPARFGKAEFHRPARFDGAEFHNGIDCEGAQAKVHAAHVWPPGWVLRTSEDAPEVTKQWGVLVAESGEAVPGEYRTAE